MRALGRSRCVPPPTAPSTTRSTRCLCAPLPTLTRASSCGASPRRRFSTQRCGPSSTAPSRRRSGTRPRAPSTRWSCPSSTSGRYPPRSPPGHRRGSSDARGPQAATRRAPQPRSRASVHSCCWRVPRRRQRACCGCSCVVLRCVACGRSWACCRRALQARRPRCQRRSTSSSRRPAAAWHGTRRRTRRWRRRRGRRPRRRCSPSHAPSRTAARLRMRCGRGARASCRPRCRCRAPRSAAPPRSCRSSAGCAAMATSSSTRAPRRRRPSCGP